MSMWWWQEILENSPRIYKSILIFTSHWIFETGLCSQHPGIHHSVSPGNRNTSAQQRGGVAAGWNQRPQTLKRRWPRGHRESVEFLSTWVQRRSGWWGGTFPAPQGALSEPQVLCHCKTNTQLPPTLFGSHTPSPLYSSHLGLKPEGWWCWSWSVCVCVSQRTGVYYRRTRSCARLTSSRVYSGLRGKNSQKL